MSIFTEVTIRHVGTELRVIRVLSIISENNAIESLNEYSKTSLSRQARGESLASVSRHYAELTLKLPNDYESTCKYYCQILVCIFI